MGEQMGAAAENTVPRSDGAMHAIAHDVCRGLPSSGPPPSRLVEFLLRYYGVSDPPPHLLVADLPTDSTAGAAVALAKRLKHVAVGRRYDRAGASRCRPTATPERQRAVVALIETRAALRPVAREMHLGQRATLEFTLGDGYSRARVVVAGPDARVHSVMPTRRSSGRFATALACSQTGIYRVELVAVGRHGDEVLANFPIYCAVEAPRTVAYRPARPLPTRPEQAERELFELTNRYRREAGRRALRPSEPLTLVARSHGLDMMRQGFVGHRSPTTGSPADRIRQAGIRYLVVRENIARSYSVEEAMQELINSPAHRANLLGDDVTHLGVGVVIDRSGSVPVLLVTQNFMRTGEPFSAETAPDVLLTQINRRRAQAHLPAVARSAQLKRLAVAFLEDVRARGDTVAQQRLSAALKRARTYRRVQGLFLEVAVLEAFSGDDQILDPALTHVGLAVRASGAEILVVALLGESIE
jgi:uncharacterized protein YkwD